MGNALRNQLLKARTEMSVVKADVGSQIDRVCQTTLANLSDWELRQLQGGIPGKAGYQITPAGRTVADDQSHHRQDQSPRTQSDQPEGCRLKSSRRTKNLRHGNKVCTSAV
jgi:hypothetical protein